MTDIEKCCVLILLAAILVVMGYFLAIASA